MAAVTTESLLDIGSADPKVAKAVHALVPDYVTAVARNNLLDTYRTVTLMHATIWFRTEGVLPIDFKSPIRIRKQDRVMLSGLEDASWDIVRGDYPRAIAELTTVMPKKGEVAAGYYDAHNQEVFVHTMVFATLLRGFLSDDELGKAFVSKEDKLTQNRAVNEFLRGVVLSDRRRIWGGLQIFSDLMNPYKELEDYEERMQKQYLIEEQTL